MKISNRLSAGLHAGLRPFKRAVLERRAAACLGRRSPGLLVPFGHHRLPLPQGASCIVVHAHGGMVQSIGADLGWIESRHGFSACWRRLPAILDLVADASDGDTSWIADLGDWVHLDGPVIGFSSDRPDSLLVPDRGFHSSAGYRRERIRAAAAPRFEDRDSAIVWRGRPTGQGLIAADPLVPENLTLRQRVRMCLALRAPSDTPTDGVDARLVTGGRLQPSVARSFMDAGILGPPVPQGSWCRRKFAIDIDGFSNAFSNLFIRLIYGCCVIKVASPTGFRQWYYGRLEPWHHFVPVAADLSDLHEMLAWCQANPRQCRDIAIAGQRFALAITPEAERERLLDMLRAARAADDHAPDLIPIAHAAPRGDRRVDRRAA